MTTSTEIKLTAAQTRKLNKQPTTSAKIRMLDSLGFSRSKIAARLNKRYQHVRNVLITPVTKPKK